MADKRKFNDMMDSLGLYYAKDVPVALKKIYWEDLGELPDDVLQNAVRAHRMDPERGRYFPRTADLVSKLGAGNQHIGSDEAWSLALESFDESSTVIWTHEISTARNIAAQIWEAGDKVGARMAFKQAYERALANSPAIPRWCVSIGYDSARRVDAINAATARGLIAPEIAQRHLPQGEMSSDGKAIAGLITGVVSEMPVSDETRSRIDEIRRMLDAQDVAEKEKRRIDLEKREKDRKAEDNRKKALMMQAGIDDVVSDDTAA